MLRLRKTQEEFGNISIISFIFIIFQAVRSQHCRNVERVDDPAAVLPEFPENCGVI